MSNDEMQMKLDLLVDDELPEAQRAAVLRGLSSDEWRELSVRFLQRQVEKKGVRQMIAAGGAGTQETPTYLFPTPHWGGWFGVRNIAAGLLIAAASVAITAAVLNGLQTERQVTVRPEYQPVSLPGNVLGGEVSDVRVQVPVLASTRDVSGELFLPADSDSPTKRTLVIVPQDGDNAVVVPVNQMAGITVH